MLNVIQNNPEYIIVVYLILGFIFSSLIYIRNKLSSKYYVEGSFLYYWIFWIFAFFVYMIDTIHIKYFSFLDRVVLVLRNKYYK
jgi:hypothetical protein